MGRTTFFLLKQEKQRQKEQEAEVVKENQKVYKELVKEYHKGGGYYDLPGIDETVKGKEEAVAKLKEADN